MFAVAEIAQRRRGWEKSKTFTIFPHYLYFTPRFVSAISATNGVRSPSIRVTPHFLLIVFPYSPLLFEMCSLVQFRGVMTLMCNKMRPPSLRRIDTVITERNWKSPQPNDTTIFGRIFRTKSCRFSNLPSKYLWHIFRGIYFRIIRPQRRTENWRGRCGWQALELSRTSYRVVITRRWYFKEHLILN